MPSTILSDNGVSSGSAGLKTTASNDGILALQTTTAGGTATTAVTINTSQAVTFAQTANLPNTFGFKNRIINGAMVIDQRNAGASVTPANDAFTLDRWKTIALQASKFTIQQNAGAVTPPAGFSNYLGVTSSSAYSVLTGDTFAVMQPIEGFNGTDLAWGTASASSVTLSFWVRSSLTGVFGGSLWNGSRGYVFTYSISSANTWEYKTVTIAGDTSGTYNSTNSLFTQVRFGLGSGATFSGTAGSWGTSNLVQPTGATSVVGTNGATFYITGVQLERGSTATSFDFRSYGTELALCQRYFYKLVGGGSSPLFPSIGSGQSQSATVALVSIPLPVTMRSSATASYNGFVSVNSGGVDYAVTSLGILYGYGSGQWVTLNVSGGGMTTGRGCIAYCAAATSDWFQLSSEL